MTNQEEQIFNAIRTEDGKALTNIWSVEAINNTVIDPRFPLGKSLGIDRKYHILGYCAMAGKNKLLDYLLKYNDEININVQSPSTKGYKHAFTPLHFAMARDNEIGGLMLILDARINVHLKTSSKESVIKFAEIKAAEGITFYKKILDGKRLASTDFSESLRSKLKEFPDLKTKLGWVQFNFTSGRYPILSASPTFETLDLSFLKFFRKIVIESASDRILEDLDTFFCKSPSWVSLSKALQLSHLSLAMLHAITLNKFDLMSYFRKLGGDVNMSMLLCSGLILGDKNFQLLNQKNAFTLLVAYFDPETTETSIFQERLLCLLENAQDSCPANIDSRDFKGKTGLIEAILSRKAQAVKVFLENGADPNCEYDGKNCFELAASVPHINEMLSQYRLKDAQKALKNRLRQLLSRIDCEEAFEKEMDRKKKREQEILNSSDNIFDQLKKMQAVHQEDALYFPDTGSAAANNLIFFSKIQLDTNSSMLSDTTENESAGSKRKRQTDQTSPRKRRAISLD